MSIADLLKGFFTFYCGHEKETEVNTDSTTSSSKINLETQALITGWENPRAVDRDKLNDIPGYEQCKVSHNLPSNDGKVSLSI